MDVDDTIVAIASPTSPAARGIVRLSGPTTADVLHRLGAGTAPADVQVPPSRARRFQHTVDVGPPLGLIEVQVMFWPTTRSYTGQPSAELHTYGSVPILEALVRSAIGAGARAARPGEYTMRAFLAGRLDLMQAEAVLGVIEAEGRGTLNHALRQLAGNLSRPLERMRDDMLNLLADVEAGLDFVDEDIEFVSDDELISRLEQLRQAMGETARTFKTRSGVTSRPTIATRGIPNAGKSSLVNALAGRDVAIVADVAGTTRDAVTIDTHIDSHPVRLVDTAGMEDADSEVSRLSQFQAERASVEADIRLWCVDISQPDAAAACGAMMDHRDSQPTRAIDVMVLTKTDLAPDDSMSDLIDRGWVATSVTSGLGIGDLRKTIATAIAQRNREETGSIIGTSARCSQTLQRAEQSLSAAIGIAQNAGGHEFVAAELRSSVNSLGEVTGAVYTDDILDRVFGRFCIGK